MGELGLRRGRVDLRSAGPITFGPAGILFLADNAAATVLAVDVADPGPAGGSEPFDLADVDARVGSFLGCEPADVVIKDMAVHPQSHNVYLSVQRGHGAAAQAVLMRISRLDGSVTDVPLEDVPVAAAAIGDAPAEDDERLDITLPLGDEGEELQVGERKIRILRRPIRTSTVTDMAYVDGTLLIAGLSNEEFSSRLRRIPFPFRAGVTGSSLEIFHVSHGKWETAAPIRAFVPYDGGASILASYTCTPVVHFPLADLTDGAKAVGRTVAELGAVNQPLDMVSFDQDGRARPLDRHRVADAVQEREARHEAEVGPVSFQPPGHRRQTARVGGRSRKHPHVRSGGQARQPDAVTATATARPDDLGHCGCYRDAVFRERRC